MKKKIVTLMCAMAVSVFGMAIPVSADTLGYYWEFVDTSVTAKLGDGYKDDMEQNYYLTIASFPQTSVALSPTNIFGTRIRRSSDNAYMSPYVLHTSKETSQPYGYSSYANTSTAYHMRGKKDSTSTHTGMLVVNGRITY